jgi:hypothetical protein
VVSECQVWVDKDEQGCRAECYAADSESPSCLAEMLIQQVSLGNIDSISVGISIGRLCREVGPDPSSRLPPPPSPPGVPLLALH